MENKNKEEMMRVIINGLVAEAAAGLLVRRDISVRVLKKMGCTEEEALGIIEEELRVATESFEEFKKTHKLSDRALSVIGIDDLLK